VDWMLLAVLVIIWVTFLFSGSVKGRSPSRFQNGMTMLARMQEHTGKRVLMPRRGERFLGTRDRARARVRERRRRVLTVLLEGVGLTALVGAFPPLRAMWLVACVLVILLALYVWSLMQLRAAAGATMPMPVTVEIPEAAPARRAPRAPTPMFDQDEVDGRGEVVDVRDRIRAGVAG